MGVSSDEINTILDKSSHLQQDNHFDILPENITVINWFLEHEHGIWSSGFNGLESLNYSQIHALFKIEKTKKKQSLFKKLLIIERSYLNEIRT